MRIKGGAGVVDSILLLPHAIVVACQVATGVHHPARTEIGIAIGVEAMARTATTELVRDFEVLTARVVLFLHHLRELLEDVTLDLENMVDEFCAVREAHGEEERASRSAPEEEVHHVGLFTLRQESEQALEAVFVCIDICQLVPEVLEHGDVAVPEGDDEGKESAHLLRLEDAWYFQQSLRIPSLLLDQEFDQVEVAIVDCKGDGVPLLGALAHGGIASVVVVVRIVLKLIWQLSYKLEGEAVAITCWLLVDED